jgi:hypothetical protein
MPTRRKVLIGLAASGLIVLGAGAIWALPIFTGPALPAGATRLQIATEDPGLTFGCAAALLSPVRVEASGDDLAVVFVESGERANVVWPAGFAAWRLDGRAVLADSGGRVVGRDGDVLATLGGGSGTADGAFHVCPFGIVTHD